MPVDIYRRSQEEAVAGCVSSLQDGVYISPWVDAVKGGDGRWQLPRYPCEIKGLPADSSKQKQWTPGEYDAGSDNVDVDRSSQVRHWGGQKILEGHALARAWDVHAFPESVQALLQVPYMPGQPVKEMFARMKALDVRPFEDKHFEEVLRDMIPEWPSLLRHVQYAESFGIHTIESPAEWAKQVDELLPSVYPTPRQDTVTVCVGVVGCDRGGTPSIADIRGAEYDYLEFLYAKDQEDKLIQILPFSSYGMTPSSFHAYSFVPPRGTSSITPFACFKLRGVWRGPSIDWDPSIGSDEMQWFAEMGPEMKLQLADRSRLQAKSKVDVAAVRHPKSQKLLPVLWPDNSWEGNSARARIWDSNVI